jgi:competence protein ComEC
MLVDGGNKGKGWSVILPYFEELGLETLDFLVVTHPDADHCGGLDDVVYEIEVGVLWENGDTADTWAWSDFSVAVDEMEVPRVTIERGDSEDIDGCEVEVLNADQGWGDSNGDSIVLSIACEGVVTLLTGDAHSGTQQEMAAELGDKLRSDVVKIPHHGSDDHYNEFATYVHPKIAVCSVGANNGYGHPSEAVLDEWEAAGAQLLRTDELGTIRLLAREGKLAVLPSD